MEEQITKLLKEAERTGDEKNIQITCAEISEILKTIPTNTSLLHARAKLYVKLDKLGAAINDYKMITSIDEDDRFAAAQIENLGTILRFRNTDIFENPNTTFDPWLE